MLRHLASRVITRSAGRYRALGLDDDAFAGAQAPRERSRRKGTSDEAPRRLERGGVSPAGQRGFHILSHLAQQGLLCFGPREGRQPTFVLLEEWLPAAQEPSRARPSPPSPAATSGATARRPPATSPGGRDFP